MRGKSPKNRTAGRQAQKKACDHCCGRRLNWKEIEAQGAANARKDSCAKQAEENQDFAEGELPGDVLDERVLDGEGGH